MSKLISIQKTAVFFAALLCLCGLYASGAQDHTVDTADVSGNAPKEYNVFQIRETFPGDPVFLYIESPLPIKSVRAVLCTDSGTTVGTGPGFIITPSYKAVIPIPLSSYTERTILNATITAVCTAGKKTQLHVYTIDVPVQQKKFVTETIPLDTKNTSIRTDSSSERALQIKKLNTIFEHVGSSIYTTGPFRVPVDGTPRRSSFYADRRVYQYSNGEKSTALHNGIDFAVPEGTPVFACASGKIVLAEWRNSTGFSVVIEHMPGLYSIYYHLSTLNTAEGTIVEKGSTIGLSGSTGLATGPHLHWEIRLNAMPANPDFFLLPFIPDR